MYRIIIPDLVSVFQCLLSAKHVSDEHERRSELLRPPRWQYTD